MQEIARECLEEAASPDADEQGGAEEQHRVEADAAPASPVGTVLQVKPKGELIKCESSTDAIQQGIKRLARRDDDLVPVPTSISQQNPTTSNNRMPQTGWWTCVPRM